MGIIKTEIERKYLVNDKLPRLDRSRSTLIRQGYLSLTAPVVRVRLQQNMQNFARIAFLTTKGPGLLERKEVEFRIGEVYAEQLLQMSICTLEKRRWVMRDEPGSLWIVDHFLTPEPIAGLWLAEIELESKDQRFVLPKWVDREVTDDEEYSNVNLAQAARRKAAKELEAFFASLPRELVIEPEEAPVALADLQPK